MQAIFTAITRDLDQMGWAAGCQPVGHWSVHAGPGYRLLLEGQLDASYSDTECGQVLAEWAGLLGLRRVETPTCEGTTEYAGQIDNMDVLLWGVTDQDAFEAEAEQDRRARRDRKGER